MEPHEQRQRQQSQRRRRAAAEQTRRTQKRERRANRQDRSERDSSQGQRCAEGECARSLSRFYFAQQRRQVHDILHSGI